MLHLLDWEYPHWMMMAGAILVAAGYIGLAFHRNRNGPVNESSRAREAIRPDFDWALPQRRASG
jgi:hypothetical protein